MANIYAINAETELDAALPDYLADHYADRRARLHGKVDRDIDSGIADMKSYRLHAANSGSCGTCFVHN